ncbi:MAG: nuclear transport factor 2 family protein [Acidobacteriota bacterium]
MKPVCDTCTTISEFLTRISNFDADGASNLFADEIEWDVPAAGGLPWGGHRTRPAEVADYFKTMWSFFESEKSVVDVTRMIVEGMDGVALGTFKHVAKTTGKSFITAFALHVKVIAGRIVQLRLYEDTYTVAKAFSI